LIKPALDDSMDEERSPLEAAETMFAKMPTASVVAATAATTVAPSPKVGNRPQTLDVSTHRERTTSEKNNNQDAMNQGFDLFTKKLMNRNSMQSSIRNYHNIMLLVR
uniref:RxLR effector candidate n=1 Tax=Haemonchus placei TaxID=6290 RepID=A0A0N4VXH3_HAEPC